MRRFKTISSIAAATLFPLLLWSKPAVNVIDNQLHLSLPSSPGRYFSILAPDKLQLSIIVPNFTLPEIQRYLQHSTFKEVIIANRNDTAFIHCFFKHPTGYAITVLPYSQTLIIMAFRWDTLSQAEFFYYSGFLALESQLWDEAQRNFEAAGILGYPKGYNYAGLIALQRGQFRNALLYFAAAVRHRAAITDVFAALSELAHYYNRSPYARLFQQHYQQLGGKSDFPALLVNVLDTLTTQPEYSLATQIAQRQIIQLLDSITVWFQQPQPSQLLSQTVHSLQPNPDSVTPTPSLPPSPSRPSSIELPSLLPQWWGTYVLVAVVSAIILGTTGLLIFYLRWRKQQQQKHQFDHWLSLLNETESQNSPSSIESTETGNSTAPTSDASKLSGDTAESQAEDPNTEAVINSPPSSNAELTNGHPPSDLLDAENTEQGHTTNSSPTSDTTNALESLLQQIDNIEQAAAKHSIPDPKQLSPTERQLLSSAERNTYRSAMVAKKLGIPRSLLKLYRRLTVQQPSEEE